MGRRAQVRRTDQRLQTCAAYCKQQGCSGHRSGEPELNSPGGGGGTRLHLGLLPREPVPLPSSAPVLTLLRTRP